MRAKKAGDEKKKKEHQRREGSSPRFPPHCCCCCCCLLCIKTGEEKPHAQHYVQPAARPAPGTGRPGEEKRRETHIQTGELPSKLRAVITSSQGGSSIEEEGAGEEDREGGRGGEEKKRAPAPGVFDWPLATNSVPPLVVPGRHIHGTPSWPGTSTARFGQISACSLEGGSLGVALVRGRLLSIAHASV